MFPTTIDRSGACLKRDAVAVFGRHRVRAGLASREFLSPWPSVLVDPRCAAEPLTVITAAWLATGPAALVTGPTAAFLHGFTAADPLPVHLVLPYEHDARRRPGIEVHNGRLLDDDRVEVAGLPVLRPERVLADLACTARPATALAVLDQAFAATAAPEREALRERLRRRVVHRPDVRGTRVGAMLVGLATGRTESPAESWILCTIVDLGFPVPEVNRWVHHLDGTPRHRLDLSWPGLRIAVEFQGHAAHVDRAREDAARRRYLEGRGWIVVLVDVEDLRSAARLERALHDAFRRRGLDLRERTPGTLRPQRHRERRAS